MKHRRLVGGFTGFSATFLPRAYLFPLGKLEGEPLSILLDLHTYYRRDAYIVRPSYLTVTDTGPTAQLTLTLP